MMRYVLLAAATFYGLGNARVTKEKPTKFHIPVYNKLMPFGLKHGDPITERQGFLVGKISVGSPRQELEVLFDLGSMELIVPSTKSSSSNCVKYHCFNESASSTFISTGHKYSQAYGDSVYPMIDIGTIGLDEVEVGGLVVTDQAFLNCKKVDRQQKRPDFVFHGIVGLNYRMESDMIETFSPPFVYNAKDQGAIDKVEIAILYPRGRKEGQLTIGGWDEKLVREDKIKWVEEATLPVEEDFSFWALTGVNDVSAEVDGTSTSGGGIPDGIMIDTGNPYFLWLPEDVFIVLQRVFNNCGYDLTDPEELNISEVDDLLPSLTFDVQGHKFTLKPSQYVTTHDDAPSDVGKGKAVALIINSQSDDSSAGGIFLRNFYIICNYEKQRIGLVAVDDIEG